MAAHGARKWRPRALVAALRRTEAGQALVEFTLVLPIFLVLIFALVDFGRGFYSWLLLTNAAREGARAGAVQSNTATITNQIYNSFCSSLPATAGSCQLDPADITMAIDNPQGDRGEQITVTLVYDFDFVTPIGSFLTLIGGTALAEPTITASSSMRLE